MAETRELINGVDGSTGRYLVDVPFERAKSPLTPVQLREYKNWVRGYGIGDPHRAPVQDVDPLKIASSGWGVLWGPDVTSAQKEALQPLIAYRRNQAQDFFLSHSFDRNPAVTKQQFLTLYRAGPGPADPRKVPYYLLIVGDPRNVPFSFQYELDVQYAVGRLHFETPEEYAAYAQGVIEAEKRQVSLPPKRAMFFGVRNDDDPGTERTCRDLIQPLVRSLKSRAIPEGEERRSWLVKEIIGEHATKARLSQLLGGEEKPSLLFTASHGMAFSADPEARLQNQGALLCQDWPGPQKGNGKILSDYYFSADDVGKDADLRGLIAFHFACFSAGTPDLSDFDREEVGGARQITPHPFLSRLAKRLLGHPRGGALAVIGHVDRAWTISFSFSEDSQVEVFDSMLKRLLDGHPVGSAMEFVNQRHAELAVELSHLFMAREDPRGPSQGRSYFDRIWRANNDARNFVVLGDPAVRLTYAAS